MKKEKAAACAQYEKRILEKYEIKRAYAVVKKRKCGEEEKRRRKRPSCEKEEKPV